MASRSVLLTAACPQTERGTLVCEDGCVAVEKILQGEDENFEECVEKMETKSKTNDMDDDDDEVTYDDEDRFSIIHNRKDELRKYKCFREIDDGHFGHPNYSVTAYAVLHGHLECLKTLHKKVCAMWHVDLAQVAHESNQPECLDYILKCMGNVEWEGKRVDLISE